MSEALSDLARLTGNSSWLQLAAMFERPCFVGALARGGVADAIERVHANTHLPQLLGTMARYEGTGDEALRVAAENFWRELSSEHTYVTGSSTSGEIWLRAGNLGDAVAPRGKDNYWAHDHAETCVAHNSMRISRRLMQWGRWAAWGRALAHAEYYERTMYNAVLGTQRGTKPGAMLYMMPLGSGVSKAGIPDAPQGHHWSDEEHHFWCCQGSGIEAFARLADSIYWRRDPKDGGTASSRQLLILQLMPSRLRWEHAAVRVTISGDYPGSVGGSATLRTRVHVERTPAANGASAARVDVWLRLPQWASAVRATASGGFSSAEVRSASAGSLLPLSLGADDGKGAVDLDLTPAIRWERIKDRRPKFAILHAALYGPLVLAALTYAERAISYAAQLTPVPPSERSRLFSVRVHTERTDGISAAAEPDSVSSGCLVRRWGSAWLIQPDGTRNFLLRPAAECLSRATPIEDTLSNFAQAHGGGKGYALDAAQTLTACTRLDGCLLPEGRSAFASGKLYLMHLGTAGSPVVLAAPPPTVTGTRKGGTDGANAASWRLSASPIGVGAGTTSSASAPQTGFSEAHPFYVESMDLPGHVLTIPASGAGGLVLERARATATGTQLWNRVAASTCPLRVVTLREMPRCPGRRRAARVCRSPEESNLTLTLPVPFTLT